MDINILIAALSLLVASLAEGRSILRDKSKGEQVSGVIHLLSIVQALDKIIEVGNELILILSEIPISESKNQTRFATLRKKKEILELVNQQIKNLEDFSEIYDVSILGTVSNTRVTLKDTIEFMMPDKKEHVPGPKGGYLRVLSWKVLEDEPTFSQLRWAARSALRSYSDSVEINDKLTELTVSFPANYLYTDKVEAQNHVSYNLKSPKDLRLLLSTANGHLQSIKDYRMQLASLIQSTFTLANILG